MELKNYLGKYPNTYSFTKNLSENLVEQEFKKGNLPVAIVRPGAVAFSLREPVTGWIDSMNGVTGGFLLLFVGLMRTNRWCLDVRCDSIPVDIFANTCITAAWITATNNK
jgi:alcohol-forming fatty acyl-CoA reductase